MSDKTASSERHLQGLKRAKSLLAETLLGFDDAEENYGYDMANERYFVREAINEIDAKANGTSEDARGVSELKHVVRCTGKLNNAVLEENWSMVEIYAGDLKHVVEDYKLDLREMVAQAWIEGNRQGWEMQTDWPKDGYRYFDEKYT